jgi:hypothetical protein
MNDHFHSSSFVTKSNPIVVGVENGEDVIPGDFFKFATYCKMKGIFVEADLIGSLIAHRDNEHTSDRQFHEPLQAPLWSIEQRFLNFEHGRQTHAKIRPGEHFFVTNIFWPNVGIFSECQ